MCPWWRSERMAEPGAVDQRALDELMGLVEPALVHSEARQPDAGVATHGWRRTVSCRSQALVGLAERALRVEHASGHRQATCPDPFVRGSVERLLGVAEGQPIVALVVLHPGRHLERFGPTAVLDCVLGVGPGADAIPSRDAHAGARESGGRRVVQRDRSVEHRFRRDRIVPVGGDCRRFHECDGCCLEVTAALRVPRNLHRIMARPIVQHARRLAMEVRTARRGRVCQQCLAYELVTEGQRARALFDDARTNAGIHMLEQNWHR